MSMDPDIALGEAREEAAAFKQGYDQGPLGVELVDVANQLVEHFVALDEWMTGGGFLPDAWKQHHSLGRPRRLNDGVVLDDVEHGTRGTYNRGCRCMECTAANRIGGAIYRARKKENQNGHV